MSRDPFAEPDDVPTGVDFHDPQHARDWVAQTIVNRPWRPRFFAAFCTALSAHGDELRILELGSGPGHLAREILTRCQVREYVALDFAAPMHELAREHLGELASRVTFLERNFRDPAWPADLAGFDAVVTLQAAHETRHKRHVTPLLARARQTLRPRGLLLYSDHYFTPSTTKYPALVLERDEQPQAVERAGFVDCQVLHDEGNMGLYAARAPDSAL